MGEGRPGTLGEMGNNRGIYCYANRGMVNFEREYQPLSPGTKIPVIPQLSYMPDQIFREKEMKKLNFRPKFDLSLGSCPPKI